MTGKEAHYLYQAVNSSKISGDGMFTKKCHQFFQERFGFNKCLLTTSCTDALEMSALLIDVQPGDEVIIPSYTFVSTANAFVLRGAKIVFADSEESTPNIDAAKLEALITDKTKAIVPVHYAGVSCDMDKIMQLANKYGLYVIEDAAQAIDSYYKGQPLGSIGHLSAFSFHETKNIISGEGGMLVVNDKTFEKRAEIIREKGTNRSAFFRGEVDKYNWVDVGSSFLPSDIIGAFLYAQLENMDDIQQKRKAIWETYYKGLLPLQQKEKVQLPYLPEYATNNGHMFYLLCRSLKERTALIDHLRTNNIQAVFHYQSLHQSPFMLNRQGKGPELPNCQRYNDTLVRLPFYYELTNHQLQYIIDKITTFYN